MNSVLVTALIGVVTTFSSSLITWFFTRRKYNSEVDNNLIQNMQSSLEFYQKLSDDNRERLEEVLKRNDDLDAEVKELRNQVFNMMGSICLNLTCTSRVRDKQIKLQDVAHNSKESTEDC